MTMTNVIKRLTEIDKKLQNGKYPHIILINKDDKEGWHVKEQYVSYDNVDVKEFNVKDYDIYLSDLKKSIPADVRDRIITIIDDLPNIYE